MASKLVAKHHECSNTLKCTTDGHTMDYVRYTHGAQFMLIGSGAMTSLAPSAPRVLMMARYGCVKEKRKSHRGGLVARGPEYNNDPTQMTMNVVTGHGIQVHRRAARTSQDIRRHTAASRSRRPMTTISRKTVTTNLRRPISAAEPSDQSQDCRRGSNQAEDRTGVVQVSLEVSHIDIDRCEGETWIRSYRRKILMLYTMILRDEQDFLQRLNFRTFVVGLVGVKFVKLAVASIVLHVELSDPKNIVKLEEFIESRGLSDLLNDVIGTQALLAELGANELTFLVRVSRDDIARCREIAEGGTTTTTTPTTGRTSAAKPIRDAAEKSEKAIERSRVVSGCGSGVRSTKSVADQPNDVYEWLRKDIQQLTSRYAKFLSDIDQFLMTLTLAKKPEVDSFRCLGDVINCYLYLRERDVIAENVRYDLIKEYLSIVNLLRIRVEDVKRSMGEMQREHGPGRFQQLEYAFAEISACFSKDFLFPDAYPDIEGDLNILNRSMYSKLLTYIPWIIDKIQQILPSA